MSFSWNVKSELLRRIDNSRHCQIAEISAITALCGTCDSAIKVHTENIELAKKYCLLIKKAFNIDCEIKIRYYKFLTKKRIYYIIVNKATDVEKIMYAAGLCNSMRYNSLVVKSTCCKRAYIRAAFLSAGSISDPEKAYHFEIVTQTEQYASNICTLLDCFGLEAKVTKRKNHFIAYLKEGEKIVDALNVMGAFGSLLELENIRIIKYTRNNVNRFVNCETANINKVVGAAVKQLEDIKFIENTKGLHFLPEQLYETACARLNYPDASLKELGETLSIGKSGVNHRLRKLSEIAEELRS